MQPEHKIHSDGGPLQLHLQLVPKMLRPLVWLWVPEAFVVSFKVGLVGDSFHGWPHRAIPVDSSQATVASINFFVCFPIQQEFAETKNPMPDEVFALSAVSAIVLASKKNSYAPKIYTNMYISYAIKKKPIFLIID